MAKAKKSKKSSSLQQVRDFAQTFTVSAAVLYGVLWLLVTVMGSQSTATDNLAYILSLATALGGIAMGLLYVVQHYKDKI